MENKTHLIEFLDKILQSNSPATRLNALYELLRQEPSYFTKEEQDLLINKFKDAKESKSKQGLNDSTKQWQNKKKKFSKDEKERWSFIKSSAYGTKCSQCHERYEIGDSIFLQNPGNHGRHINCTPNEIKENDKLYQEALSNGELNK
jgi:hypothetical protein